MSFHTINYVSVEVSTETYDVESHSGNSLGSHNILESHQNHFML